MRLLGYERGGAAKFRSPVNNCDGLSTAALLAHILHATPLLSCRHLPRCLHILLVRDDITQLVVNNQGASRAQAVSIVTRWSLVAQVVARRDFADGSEWNNKHYDSALLKYIGMGTMSRGMSCPYGC